MLPEQKEHARQILHQARQIRHTVSVSPALGSSRQGVPPLLIESYDQLLELAESLLAEQEQYESRLHRTRMIDPSTAVGSSHPQ